MRVLTASQQNCKQGMLSMHFRCLVSDCGHVFERLQLSRLQSASASTLQGMPSCKMTVALAGKVELNYSVVAMGHTSACLGSVMQAKRRNQQTVLL